MSHSNALPGHNNSYQGRANSWRHPHCLAVVPVELKGQLRQVIFQMLFDPQNKIRSLSAQIITTIAIADWPDEWPDLLDTLIALLSSNSPQSVHGAMQVTVDFIKADLTEDQILPVLRQLLPTLLNILGAPEQHSMLTRARAVGVFRTCVETLFMVREEHPRAVKEAAQSVLLAWLDVLKFLLNINPTNSTQDIDGTPNWDGVALRQCVCRPGSRGGDVVQRHHCRLPAPHSRRSWCSNGSRTRHVHIEDEARAHPDQMPDEHEKADCTMGIFNVSDFLIWTNDTGVVRPYLGISARAKMLRAAVVARPMLVKLRGPPVTSKGRTRKGVPSLNTNPSSYNQTDPFAALNALCTLHTVLPARLGGYAYKLAQDEHWLTLCLLTLVELFVGLTPQQRMLTRKPTEILDAWRDLLSLVLACKRLHAVVFPRHYEYRLFRCKMSRIVVWSHLAVHRSLACKVHGLESMDECSSEHRMGKHAHVPAAARDVPWPATARRNNPLFTVSTHVSAHHTVGPLRDALE
ncbi:hypothetical protein FOMPIDRAFT_1020806 [Fomitopsis schrenkii]|uniref:Exportin-1/Importin-beta-like domain-containing protein n=1 Tax=Fomitopsis schrenkii TaxID=2126942 RepID=S8ETC7_FOMSC|nr:hypothetical protein FOMPIDRAFT_1020806 [Fomitopsis schrenkii]